MAQSKSKKQKAAFAKMQRGLAKWRRANGKPVAKKKRRSVTHTKRRARARAPQKRRRAGYAPAPVIILVEE